MAGPWFTVHRINGDWLVLDRIWIGDGSRNWRARIEARIDLLADRAAAEANSGMQVTPATVRPRDPADAPFVPGADAGSPSLTPGGS